MRSVEELIGKPRLRRAELQSSLGAFCDYLAEALHPARCGKAPAVEAVADAFRQFYRLPVPVGPRLSALCETAGIALIRHGNVADRDVCSDFNGETQQWEIYLRADVGLRESLCLLRELFTILSCEAHERISWWQDWLVGIRRTSTMRPTDRFAYAVVLPSKPFYEQAIVYGLNPWTLATRFLTTPGACFFALTRALRLPVPYFQAHLNFRPPAPDQTRLFFEEESVQAEIWRKSFCRVSGRGGSAWPGMQALAASFPPTGRRLEVAGVLFQAIKTCRPLLATIDRIAGRALPEPVCLVARPNGAAQSQMFLQAVPCGWEGILLDDALDDRCPDSSPSQTPVSG